MKLTGGTIIGHNHAKNGGGVYVPNIPDNNDTLTLKLINTTLCNNIATEYGGGIFNEEQIVTSENNDGTITFHGNRAVENDGGGIYNKGEVLLIGTTYQHIFTENRASRGGGIYTDSICSLQNCQIGQSGKGNVAATAGGGIFVGENDTTTLLLGNITFEGNHANYGGGLYNKGKVTQEDGCILTFDHNIADMNGGGVYHSGNPLTLKEAIFKNDTAYNHGGGIYTDSICSLLYCQIGQSGQSGQSGQPNHAKNGGGIYMNGKELTIQGGWVSHNTASNNGGGIYLEQKNTLVNNNCLIQNNKANNNGGGIYVQQKKDAIKQGDYKFSALTVIDSTNAIIGTLESGIIKKSTGEVLAVDVYIMERPFGLSDESGEQEFYVEGQINDNAKLPVRVYSYTTYFQVYGEKVEGCSEWEDSNDCKFILRFKQTDGGVDYYLDLECGITYYEHPVNGNFYEYRDSLVIPAETIPLPAILTLNGSTVGGAGMGNEATNGDGGGIYIGKDATVIMTSDTNNVYSSDIRNEVTHNKAKRKAGGVYKDGTLKVEGHVVITENTADHSTGGGSKAGEVPENVYIPTESDDDQTILIIGELACGSSIGVTKTKKWMEEGEDDENATDNEATAQYGNQGEHIYERDLFFKQVNTPIAQVSSTGEELWAEDAFYKRIYFDDKGYYRVWSFDFYNYGDGEDYSDQKDYFIETWRSYANAAGFRNDTVSTNAGFAYFAKQVNDGVTFDGSNIPQVTTIDLDGHHWEPIGYTYCGLCNDKPHRPFAGTYNGNGHFILNAISILPEKEMGLFGNVTGTVKHTFTVGDQFYNTHDHAFTNDSCCFASLGAIVGNTTGIIDGCEAAKSLLHVHYHDNNAPIAAGGIAGNVGGTGEVRNSFTSHINFSEDKRQNGTITIAYGTFDHCGGLVGNIASGGKVKNCYTKVNSAELFPESYAAIVGNNGNTQSGNFTNCYTSATSGKIVGSGTAGTNVYAPEDDDPSDEYVITGQTATYTPTIGADHLGYMCIDNGVPYSTCGLTTAQKENLIEGKDYFEFHDGNGNVTLIPLFRLLNLNAKALNNSNNYTPYAEWARPALAYYEGLAASAGTTGFIECPINGDLPLLMLNNYVNNSDASPSPKIGQGGFRSVGTYGGGGDVLQYGGPDRDGNQLDAALTRAKVTGTTGDDYLFVYGDVNVAPIAQCSTFTQAKVSIYEHTAISRAGTLAGFTQTYVGVTFDNSGKVSGSATNGINYIDNGPSLPRDWHIFSTPLTDAPLGFNYPGEQNTNTYPAAPTTINANSGTYYNNPWGNEEGTSNPNSPSAKEFTWLNEESEGGHNRYWMYGWTNSRDAGTHDASSYPASTWTDGYFPSKVNTSAIQFGAQLFIPFANNNGSNEYVNGNHRYPYGMDFYSWYEPKYHYINFKRNGPNHWHSNAPHVHLDYTPEEASNNSGATAFGQNVNETTLLDGKGYMASIHIPTFLQTSGSLGGSTKTIKVTYNENDLDLCEGWNLVGNPFHAYLDFNQLCTDNSGIITDNQYLVYNADGFGSTNNDGNSGNYGNGFSYYVAGSSQHGAYASQYLHPHQGFFVKVNEYEENTPTPTLTFKESHTTLRSDLTANDGSYRDDSRPAYPLVNLFLTSDKGCSDVCVVEFNRPEWGGATKLRDMYSGNGLFYAAHDNGNYAALFATPEAERIPLKFEAKDEAGDTYTIHWNTQNGDFHKLYLVDNITGVQYDMLRNSSYSFSGKKDDYWTRFYITFEVTGLDEEQDDEDDDASTGSASTTFAFFDGSQWVVTNDGHGTATLDLIDLQGRVLHSTTLAEGQARIGLPDVAKGMYLMRMTNQNGMFVQKIVVR